MVSRQPVRIYLHFPVIVIPLHDPVDEVPEELHLDEGDMSEEEFEAILPYVFAYYAEYSDESTDDDEWPWGDGQ